MNEETKKKVIKGTGTGEITEKRSRFIANCFEVHSEEEALSKIEGLKKKYWDARHNCYAYIIGSNMQLKRMSDDKEPQGTAGRPILDVLVSYGLYDVLVVVTRYFGGILLGTGGLVRAYTEATREGLKRSTVLDVYDGFTFDLTCSYDHMGKIIYSLEQLKNNGACFIKDTKYSDNVQFAIAVETSLFPLLEKNVTEISSGSALLSNKTSSVFADNNGSVLLL